MSRRHRSNSGRTYRFARGLALGLACGVAVGVASTVGFVALSPQVPSFVIGGSRMAPAPILAAPISQGPIRLKRGAIIICEGDSLTYGFQRDPAVGYPPINGSDKPRDILPYPEALQARLGDSVQVVNRGFPGDTVWQGMRRWRGKPSGDLAVIMYGTNDAGVRGGEQVDMESYAVLLEALVRRRLYSGAQVILLIPPPVSPKAGQNRLSFYREAVLSVASRTGVRVLDAGSALSPLSAQLQYDGVHLTTEGNAAVAALVAKQISVD